MRKILLTLISIVGLGALVACGNSGGTSAPSGPTGGNNAGFSTASLKGTYVFSASGVNSSGNSVDVLGIFTADGNGNVTSGTRDSYSDSGNATQLEPITGTYSVNADGRGEVLLNGSTGQAAYRFVMQSATTATFFQFSSSNDDTGRLQLQSTVAAPTGTYAIRLDGEDAASQRYVYGAVGGITISGTSVTGNIDQNDDGVLNNTSGVLSAPLAITSGSVTSPDSTGRGTLSFAIGGVSHNFVYYFVSPSQIQLASTDNFFLHGYADLQTSVSGSTAGFSGDQVFSLNGSNASGPLLETGRFTLDGAGNVTNAVEDYLQGGSSNANYFGDVTFAGTYSASSNGRWTAQVGGAAASNLVGWQVSPQQSLVLSWNTNSTILETGTLRAQNTTVTTASIDGNYAVDLSGYSYTLGGDVELTGNFDASAGSLTGTFDSQTPGYFNTDVAATGAYSIQSNGRSPGGNVAGVPVVFYTVDANTAYMISTDSTRFYQGKMVAQ
jgi:hypothetical protein